MCYILTSPKLTKEHIEVMQSAWLTNSDMAGIAYHDGRSLLMIKPIPTWKSLRRNLWRLLGYPVIAHCRLATHGKINGYNTHPFWTCQHKALLAHNGIMPPPWSCVREKSDSRSFAEMLLKIPYWEVSRSLPAIGKAIGHNKVAIMQEDGEVFLINGDLGHQQGADWYSMNPDYLFTMNSYGGWSRVKAYQEVIYINGQYRNSYKQPTQLTLTAGFNEPEELEEYENWLKVREPINSRVYNQNYGKYEELEGGCQ